MPVAAPLAHRHTRVGPMVVVVVVVMRCESGLVSGLVSTRRLQSGLESIYWDVLIECVKRCVK